MDLNPIQMNQPLQKNNSNDHVSREVPIPTEGGITSLISEEDRATKIGGLTKGSNKLLYLIKKPNFNYLFSISFNTSVCGSSRTPAPFIASASSGDPTKASKSSIVFQPLIT